MYTNPANSTDTAVTASPGNLSRAQRQMLDSALRVDQAGEVAANWIYKGQMFVLHHDPVAGPLIEVHGSTSIFHSLP
jgi:ubiquinone biosynthesis monooxygenase Coq7